MLTRSLTGHQPSANYCCGGAVSITTKINQLTGATTSRSACRSPPIVIRWDAPDDSHTGRRIQFPLASNTGFKSQKVTNKDRSKARRLANDSHITKISIFDQMIQDLSPSVAKNDDGDTASHTRRYKLNSINFLTGFQPNDYGILNDITQILLPNQANPSFKPDGALFAQLIELNVSI